MSGTLMLLGAAGYELHYMNISNGSLGTTQFDTPTIVAMRRREAAEAAASIGAVFHESICSDLDVFYDRATLASVASVMREVAPDIVLTHSPVDYMEDHTNACRLAVTAAFARGMPNFPVTPPRPADHEAGGPVPRPALLEPRSAATRRDARLLRRRHGSGGRQGRDAGQTCQSETVAGRKPGARFLSADAPGSGRRRWVACQDVFSTRKDGGGTCMWDSVPSNTTRCARPWPTASLRHRQVNAVIDGPGHSVS